VLNGFVNYPDSSLSGSWTSTGRLCNRAGTLDVTSILNEHTLAETVVWCSLQRLTSVTAETDEMRHRRGQIEEARRILRGDVYKSPDWQRAMRLLKEANPDSLAPLEGQLLSKVLEPNISLSRSQSEAERGRTVADVVNKRSRCLKAGLHEFSQEQVLLEGSGRLLTYIPSENVADGSSRYSSKASSTRTTRLPGILGCTTRIVPW
jgi:hypothetical protein